MESQAMRVDVGRWRIALATTTAALFLAFAGPHALAQGFGTHHHNHRLHGGGFGFGSRSSFSSSTVVSAPGGTLIVANGFGLPYPVYGLSFYLPPLLMPAGVFYGPVTTMPGLAGRAANANLLGGMAGFGLAPTPAPSPRAPRRSNDASMARAQEHLKQGDAAMREQKLVVANREYRRAIALAPDLPDGYFRRGLTLVGLGRYGDAARLVRRGLEVDPQWPRHPLVLDALYGPNQVAKAAHLEALARQAISQPHDANLLFLVGVELYLDNARARSRKFFERANQLTPGAGEHLRAFLNEIAIEQPAMEGKGRPAGGVDL